VHVGEVPEEVVVGFPPPVVPVPLPILAIKLLPNDSILDSKSLDVLAPQSAPLAPGTALSPVNAM
jgi:hypothetical protein